MNQAPEKKNSSKMARNALVFGSGTLTSRFLGLIRDSLLFSLLPIDMKDAWLAAFRLPNFFRRLLGEGGLSVSFIPIYISLLGEGESEKRERLVNGVFTLLMSLVGLICLMGFFFMEEIITFWLSGKGFTEVPGKLEMTIVMAKIMVAFLFFVTLFAFFMAILNSHRKFGLSGFAPLFLNLAIIIGLVSYRSDEQLAQASAFAVVVGGCLQALFLLPGIIQVGVVPKFSLSPFSAEVKKVFVKFVPTIFGVGVLQILALVNLAFASQIQGGVSYIYLGDRLLELPLSLIAVSIGTTLLPTLSGLWSANEKDSFSRAITQNLSLFYFLAVPAAFGLWFVGIDIVDVLFKRGEFLSSEVVIVGGILKIYCLTLLAAGSLKILNQALYATGDTLTPAILSAAGLVLHLFAAPKLMASMGINGLVLSTALVSLFNLIGCLLFLQTRVVSLRWVSLFKNVLFCFIAACFMGAYLWWVSQISWKQGRFILDFPLLLLIIGVGGLIYFSVSALLKVDELNYVLNRFRLRLKK